MKIKRMAVFASGNGGNLQAIIDAVKNKKIKAQIVLVFSDKSDAYALVRAKKAHIPTAQLNVKDFASRVEYDQAILKILKSADVDLIVLAGYMRLMTAAIIDAYPRRIINIHPSLLPAFKGTQGIKDAFDYGVKVTGVSVHYVSLDMDAGEIIAQQPVEIHQKDTLETLTAKIHKIEHQLYPKVIARVLKQL